ncbi:hypothetical protein GKO32_12565 [Amycolatopsis sp. RM579]|uniref:Lipoprotein n=2 Tax=Amycolatopsis pithecellobii TaxID=664692 RepID=A0A6N7YS99_9PSEU|nr:hypothetical protein [Amycolatopsis pithecellobii]
MNGFLVLLMVLVASACEAAPGTRGPDSRAAIDGALAALRTEPAVAYDLAGGAVLNVTGKGLAQGTLPLRGEQAPIVRAGGDLYLRAPATYWQAQGMSADRAAEYGARWARSTPGVDPGWLLTPATLAQALRAAVPDTVRASRITLAGGLDALDAAGLRVTAVPPFRVLDFEPALLGSGVSQTLGDPRIGVRAFRPSEHPALRTAFDNAVDSLGQPFVAGPVVAATVTGNTLACTTAGACTDTVQVANRLLGEAPEASARLVLRSSVSADRLGAQDCGQELVTPFDAATTMSCSVKFALPKVSGTAQVSALPAVTAEPVADLDPAAFKQAAAAELG